MECQLEVNSQLSRLTRTIWSRIICVPELEILQIEFPISVKIVQLFFWVHHHWLFKLWQPPNTRTLCSLLSHQLKMQSHRDTRVKALHWRKREFLTCSSYINTRVSAILFGASLILIDFHFWNSYLNFFNFLWLLLDFHHFGSFNHEKSLVLSKIMLKTNF